MLYIHNLPVFPKRDPHRYVVLAGEYIFLKNPDKCDLISFGEMTTISLKLQKVTALFMPSFHSGCHFRIA